MLGGVDGAENVLEIARAGAEDDAVGLHGVALAGQRHVSKVFVLPVSHTPELIYIFSSSKFHAFSF